VQGEAKDEVVRRMRYTIFILLLLLTACSHEQIKPDFIVDFGQSIGSVQIRYGANENDAWSDFVDIKETHELHRQVGSEYIRVWIADPSWRESTIPLKWDYYDFTELDSFIEAVLDSGATPYIVFASAPEVLRTGQDHMPPDSISEFADYVAEIVTHYRDFCIGRCDINKWYFEIWNEPWQALWWEDEPALYTELYCEVYTRIKDIVPEVKVGGFTLDFFRGNTERLERFLNTCQADFVSVHHYGNVIDEHISDDARMRQTKLIFYDSMIMLKEAIGTETEIINSEYSSDFKASYMDRLDEEYTAAWYANSLIWQIKSQVVDMEMFYSGTTELPHSGFGMWSTEGGIRLWPVYHMKSEFVRTNTLGSEIFVDDSDEKTSVLAVRNKNGHFLTIVNNEGIHKSVILELKGAFRKARDEESNYRIRNGFLEINLEPYQVRFIQLS